MPPHRSERFRVGRWRKVVAELFGVGHGEGMRKITVAFVMSSPRSGSTWLNSVLGSLSWARNLGEYYRPFLMPGHVACRLCEADGLPECAVLHGVEAVPIRDAFHFAAERLGVSVLAESSKDVHWCGAFTARPDIDARVVHLVRHPCGFVESHGRRLPALSPDELLDMWERQNREIARLALRAPYLAVSYDDLAAAPDTHFPRLCEFIGGAWEPPAIEYWRFPHHGLGGNGAAALYLKGRPNAKFTTGDDAHYDNIAGKPTVPDTRWTTRLPGEFIQRAITSPYAVEIGRLLGREWTAHG